MTHYDNLMKLMRAKPQDAIVELIDLDEESACVYTNGQLITFWRDGEVLYHYLRDKCITYHDAETFFGEVDVFTE